MPHIIKLLHYNAWPDFLPHFIPKQEDTKLICRPTCLR